MEEGCDATSLDWAPMNEELKDGSPMHPAINESHELEEMVEFDDI